MPKSVKRFSDDIVLTYRGRIVASAYLSEREASRSCTTGSEICRTPSGDNTDWPARIPEG